MLDITAKECDSGRYEKVLLKLVNRKDSYVVLQLRV